MKSNTVTVAILAQGTHWAVADMQAFSRTPIGLTGTATHYTQAIVVNRLQVPSCLQVYGVVGVLLVTTAKRWCDKYHRWS